MTSEPNPAETAHQDGTLSSLSAMLQAFQSPASWRMTAGENWVQFWRGQDVILTCMEELAGGWFRRRHVATETALDMSMRCCEAATPFDIAREVLTWQMGSFQRVMQDGLACQKCCMELAKLTPRVASEEDAAHDDAEPRARIPAQSSGTAKAA